MKRTVEHPQFIRAQFDPASINKDRRTIDVVFATEREVKMYNWSIGLFREVLECNDDAGDLSRLNNGAPLLDTHAKYSVKTDVLGVVEKAWFDKGKGRATVRFSKRADAELVWQDVIDGVVTGVSVGYDVSRYETTEEDGKLPLYRATKWAAAEISLAPVQADPDSGVGRSNDQFKPYEVEIINTNHQKQNTMNRSSEILKMVRAAGLSLDFAQPLIDDETITIDQARTKIDAEKARIAQSAPAPAPAPDGEAVRKEGAKAERKRASEITAAVRAAKLTTEFAEELIADEHCTIEQARTKIIEKMAASGTQSNNTNPAPSVGREDVERFRTSATNGMALRSGQIAEKIFKPEELAAARSFQGSSLIRFAAICLERAGINTSGMSDMEIAKRAITTSSSDFPIVLENVLHKMLLSSYQVVPDSWRNFCAVGSVTDFRAHKRLRPGSLSRLDKVLENGELKNKKLEDATSESITAQTFGNIINISRNTIINDDLGYFGRLTSDLGRAAARSIEIDVYALLAENSGDGPTMSDNNALFHTSHGNKLGTGTAPTVASFDLIKQAMRKQKDHSGNDFLDIRPSILVLGVHQSAAADAINDSMYDPDATNKLQKKNTSFKTFDKIVDTARISGNQQYAFADPAILPVLEVAFLNGVQSPYLEQEQSFEQLGLRWRVYFDYAVGAIDWKGAVENPGA
jgi:hypothetical protein